MNLKIQKLKRHKIEPSRFLDAHNRGLEAKMEPWRVCRPVVADSQNFDEGQDPGPH
jgi:hypothetical protein